MNPFDPHKDSLNKDAKVSDWTSRAFERIRNRDAKAPGFLSRQTTEANGDDESLDLWDDDLGEGSFLRRLLFIGFGLLLVAIVGGGILISFNSAEQVSSPKTLPLVQALPEPEKVRPEDPGGMRIDHQDALVLNQLSSDQLSLQKDADRGRVEQLLPPPELPLDIPLAEDRSLQTADRGKNAAATAIDQTGRQGLSDPQDSTIESVFQPPLVTAAGDGSAKATVTFREVLGQLQEKTPESGQDQKDAEKQQEERPPLPSGQYVVQLAAFVEENRALEGWAQLKKALPQLLKDQRMIVEKADISHIGTRYRLQTGPFPSRSAGMEFCQKVRATERDCLVKEVK